MEQLIQEGVLFYFHRIEDPRVLKRCKHRLIDVIAIAVCARICGAESFVEMEEFGIQRELWFKEFLELSNGIPSHDTFCRVFSILEPRALELAFQEWVKSIRKTLSPCARVSLDGKTVNGTYPKFNGVTRPLVLVNAFCHDSGLTLTQAQAPSTGNAETKAALACIDDLDLEKALVSVDAGVGRRSVLTRLIEKKAHYLVPVKSNARTQFLELKIHIKKLKKEKFFEFASNKEENSHGRNEKRQCFVMDSKGLSERFKLSYPEVKSVIEIERIRNREKTNWMYVSSKKLNAEAALHEIRDHWKIENRLHWSLDVIFDEDGCRVREKVAARNLSLIRKIAFNLLQTCPQKGSKLVKIKRAAWNPEYLQNLLINNT